MDEYLSLAAEIAERLDELEDQRLGSAHELVAALATLSATSRVAFRIAIQHMHNAPERYLSYAAQAEKRGISKQAIHAEFQRHLAHIRAVLPAVADSIEAMRDSIGSAQGPRSQSCKPKDIRKPKII